MQRAHSPFIAGPLFPSSGDFATTTLTTCTIGLLCSSFVFVDGCLQFAVPERVPYSASALYTKIYMHKP